MMMTIAVILAAMAVILTTKAVRQTGEMHEIRQKAGKMMFFFGLGRFSGRKAGEMAEDRRGGAAGLGERGIVRLKSCVFGCAVKCG
jgi:hypothetical protein